VVSLSAVVERIRILLAFVVVFFGILKVVVVVVLFVGGGKCVGVYPNPLAFAVVVVVMIWKIEVPKQ